MIFINTIISSICFYILYTETTCMLLFAAHLCTYILVLDWVTSLEWLQEFTDYLININLSIAIRSVGISKEI